MSRATGLRCVHCDATYPLQAMFEGCPACAKTNFASGLTPTYEYEAIRSELGDGPLAESGSGIWQYRRLLPVRDPAHELSLGEGNTAVIPLPRLAEELKAAEVWVKDESRNPTWSFKDRNAAVTLSKARELGAHTVVVSTSGNHGAAVAAYAARGSLRCVALTYPGVPAPVRVLMQAYGAEVVVTTPEGRWALMREGVREYGWYPASNYTDIPTSGAYGHDGYKTIAYELHEQLGGVTPDLVVVPTAYAEGLYGVWKGFEELAILGRIAGAPRMIAAEPEGGPLGVAFERGDGIARVPRRATVARGIGGTVSSYLGVAALSASDGMVAQATDAEILVAQRDLAAEGIFAEPASATALAGLRNLARNGAVPQGLRIVLVNTSSGLKNLESILASYPGPAEIAPSFSALNALIERSAPRRD